MSFYEPQGWQAPARQTSWEQPPPPSRSGASSTSQSHDNSAFATQFEEVERAVDNLVKSGKIYPQQGPRRESLPQAHGGQGRSFDHGPRYHGGRHPVSENIPGGSGATANIQNFYASQRYQGRPNEADHMAQAKRRMAAQRERELRNYHQEQQYNRSVLAEMASNKSDRSMSPSTLSEEGRRELIARQHRALYGADAPGFAGPQNHFGEDSNNREQGSNAPTSTAGGMRGQSPRGVDPFGAPGQPGEAPAQSSAVERKSPVGPQNTGKIPTPPSGEDAAHSRQLSKSTTAPTMSNMGPIGSRPTGQHAPAQSLNKRTTSPLPTSLNYGFGVNDPSNERSQSSNSNANNQKESSNTSMGGAWGTGSGVWGSNKIGATSVWG